MAVSQSLTLTQKSQDISANSSSVRILWQSTQTGDSWNGYKRTAKYYISKNGGAETEYTVEYTLPKKTTQTILDITVSVPHKSDGTGSISVRTWMDTGISSGAIEKTQTLTLTAIPRLSTMTVTNGTLGEGQKITVTQKNSSFTHSIRYSCGAYSGYIKADGTSSTNEYMYSNCSLGLWTPPLDFANEAPDKESVSVSFKITTYKNAQAIGSEQITASFAIPSNIKPPVAITVEDINGYKDHFGNYIQAWSKLRVVINTYGSYSAWIRSYKLEVDGASYTSGTRDGNYITIDTSVIKNSGTLPLKVTVTDSRGRSTVADSSISVLAYAFPKITSIAAYRSDANGNSAASGAYLTVRFSSTIYSLNSKNNAEYRIEYKKNGASYYTPETITKYAGQYSVTNGKYTFPADDSSYDINLYVKDYFKEVPQNVAGSSVNHIISMMKKNGKIVGMAINKLAETEGVLDINFPLKLSAGFYDDGSAVSADEEADRVVEYGETDGWLWRKWESGIAECRKTVTVSTAISTAWGTMYVGTTKMSRQSYPFVFTAKPLEVASVTTASNAVWLFPESGGNGVNGAYQTAIYNVCRPSAVSTAGTYYITIDAKGKWK